MFDWQDLRYFLTVARLGSMTAAAAELRVDHATVGRRIAKLEAAIGMKLMVRLPRATRLTEQGVALAEAAMTMVTAISASTGASRRAADGQTVSTQTIRYRHFGRSGVIFGE